MSIITIFKIENEFFRIEENIKKLKLLNDRLIFQIIIHNSIKTLLLMSQLIKNKNNLFGKSIETSLLATIISFLPYEYRFICRNICTSWLKNLKSSISKRLLLPAIPKNIIYPRLLELKFRPKTMTRIKNDIYVGTLFGIYKINEKFEVIAESDKNFRTYIMSGNDNYICVVILEHICIYSLNMKLICKIKTKRVQGMAIDNKNRVCVSTSNKFHIYNLEGNIINSWDLVDNSDDYKYRNIAFNDDEIFMVDTSFNKICVFSYEGKLIRSWGEKGKKPGNFNLPMGIAIYRDMIFVVDLGNYRIQTFTCYGKFILERKHEYARYISDIVIANNCIYICDQSNSFISKFELIY
jgi:CNH domain.